MVRPLTEVLQPPSNLRQQFRQCEKQELQAYEALAALLRYVSKKKAKLNRQHWTDFAEFKKALLGHIDQMKPPLRDGKRPQEPRFNVRHYQRAIFHASDSTYRDMAIQAAHKDLTQIAMFELIRLLAKECEAVSRGLRALKAELRKSQVDADANVDEFQYVQPLIGDAL